MSHGALAGSPPSGSRFSKSSFSESRLADSELQKTVDWVKKDKNFLIFFGNPGIGKTYFCHALVDFLKINVNYKFTVRYWKEREILQRLRSSMEGSVDYSQQLKYLIDDHLILIDDLGSGGYTDWRKEVLIDLIDYRYESQLPTVFTSNLTEKDIIEQFHPRVHSRLWADENTFIYNNVRDLRQTEKRKAEEKAEEDARPKNPII